MYLHTPSILALWATLNTAASIPSHLRRQDSYQSTGDISFPVQRATLKNARVGEQFQAEVAGLVIGQGNATAQFEKTGGASWVQVSDEGVILGTPGDIGEGAVEVDIQATSGASSTATIRLTIPVRGAGQALVEQLAIMSYNLWQGGANVNNYHEKQLRFILESGADVIGLQESVDGDHAARLARALGWEVSQTNRSAAIISRYPVVEEYDQVRVSRGVRINLNGESEDTKQINFWNSHLTAYPYGPYGFCFDSASAEIVLQTEAESGRTPEMAALIEAIGSQLASAGNVPVLLTGDTNAPSHLDWVEGLREKNCGVADFDWPTSILPAQAGLIDSYRVAHPDPVAEQGTTWSPLYPFNEGTTGEPEPQDRIDFVYATAQLEVISSETLLVREPQPVPNAEDNEWTSDHRAVLTLFRLP